MDVRFGHANVANRHFLACFWHQLHDSDRANVASGRLVQLRFLIA
jgi:hypothetical protein